MLSRHRSSFRVFPNWLLTTLSGACVIAGTAVLTTPPAAGAAPLADVAGAARPVTVAAPVVTRAPHVSDPRHAWHEKHVAHVLFLENQAKARAAAAWAAAHKPKVSHDTFTQSAPVTVSVSGPLTTAAVETLWEQAGGPSWAAPEAARIAYCESGYNPRAYNPSGASGIWQVLGAVVPGNLFDPYVNAENAVAKFKGAGNTFAAWVCR